MRQCLLLEVQVPSVGTVRQKFTEATNVSSAIATDDEIPSTHASTRTVPKQPFQSRDVSAIPSTRRCPPYCHRL